MSRLFRPVLPAMLALLALALPARAAPRKALVCYPGGPVNAKQAESAVAKMLGHIELQAGFEAGTFESGFTSDLKKCRARMKAEKPAIVILSLGLFLEHRAVNHLLPLVRPRIDGQLDDVYRLLVPKGRAKTLAELKGKTLSGTLLAETLFLKRVVFRGSLDPETYFQLQPSRQALRSLRKLAKGELDAVLVNELQFSGLKELPFADKLEAIWTSAPMPLVGVAVDETRFSADEVKRLRRSIEQMCGHSEGKEMCELFGLQGFEPVDATTYQAVEQLWRKGE